MLPAYPPELGFPRTRGGDPVVLGRLLRSHLVFPAHAGVILGATSAKVFLASFPRTRGGDPVEYRELARARVFSPHTRG